MWLLSVSEQAFVGVDWRLEGEFLSNILKETSSETTGEIQIQLQANASTAELAREHSPPQHTAPSNHSLVKRSSLQKWPVGPTKREVVVEQPRSVHSVPVALAVNVEPCMVPPFELAISFSLICLFS